MSMMFAALGVISLGLLVALALVARKLRVLNSQYAGVTNAEAEIARLKAEAANTIERERSEAAAAIERQKSEASAEAERAAKEIEDLRKEAAELVATEKNRRDSLDAEYAIAKATYDRLSEQVALLEENLEDISFSLYKPHFNFDTPEEYKVRLESV